MTGSQPRASWRRGVVRAFTSRRLCRRWGWGGAPPSLNPGIDLLAIMRNALESRPDMLQPGAGWLPESWLPLDSVERALRAVSRGPASAKLRYDPPRGLESLRRLIAARLTERGAPVDPA